jgi:hypothetical protein
MTLQQLVSRIGSEATLSIEQMAVRVIVRDVRHAYGRTHYLVEPVAGSGRQWVDSGRLDIDR